MIRLSGRLFAFSLIATLVANTNSVAQQWSWPEKGENLQVLPEGTGGHVLRGVMASFTRGLGVRCWHCHVGEPGQPLSTYDFKSDDKPTKQTARLMMQMRQTINDSFISKVSTEAEQRLQVNCVTCHRGQPRPVSLEQVLYTTIVNEGAEAGLQKYHDLHKRFYGGFTHDFRAHTLNNLGYQLLGAENYDAAIAVFKLNVEQYPDYPNGYDSLGEAYMKAGNTELAIANYEKALQLNPKNKNAEKMLKELSKK